MVFRLEASHMGSSGLQSYFPRFISSLSRTVAYYVFDHDKRVIWESIRLAAREVGRECVSTRHHKLTSQATSLQLLIQVSNSPFRTNTPQHFSGIATALLFLSLPHPPYLALSTQASEIRLTYRGCLRLSTSLTDIAPKAFC